MDEKNEVRKYLVRELDGRDKGSASAPPWAPLSMGENEGCYVIKTKTNGVFLDARVVGQFVQLSMINVQHQRRGFGTTVMDTMAQFAKERGLAVQVGGITNSAFFDTIKWLNEDDRSTFGPPDAEFDDD